jgi:hypothetical protein
MVGMVDHYNGAMTIYDKAKLQNPIVIDSGFYKFMNLKFHNGASASEYEITENMLLSIAESYENNGEKVLKILISDTKPLKGKITEIGDDYIEFNEETVYNSSGSYELQNLKVGDSVSIYLNIFGNIGYIDNSFSDVFRFGLIAECDVEKSVDKIIRVKMLIETGVFKILSLANNVEIDGTKYKRSKQYNVLKSVPAVTNLPAGKFPVRYILNNSGEIITLDTPYKGDDESEQSLREYASGSGMCTNDYILLKSIPVGENSTVMVTPNATSLDEWDYDDNFSLGTRGLLKTGADNTIIAFKVNQDSLNADFIIRITSFANYDLAHNDKLFLVRKLKQVYDESEENIVWEIEGIEAGVEKSVKVSSLLNENRYIHLNKGDVIRIAYNSTGYAVALDNVFLYNITDGYTGSYYLPSNAQKSSTVSQSSIAFFYAGYVKKREGSLLEIIPFDLSATSQSTGVDVPNAPNWDEASRVLKVDSKISVYDPSLDDKDQIYIGEMEDIADHVNSGELVKIIARYRSFNYQEIIVLRDSTILKN